MIKSYHGSLCYRGVKLRNDLRGPLKIRIKSNADRIFENNENRRKHSRKAMLRRFEAAIENYSKFDKIIIFRGALNYTCLCKLV